MDLGTYERMLDQDLSRPNFTTSGQIYTRVLEQGAPRRLPRPRRADDPARHRRGEASPARAGGDAATRGRRGLRRGRRHGRRLRERLLHRGPARTGASRRGPSSTCFVALTYILEPPHPRRAEVQGRPARHQAADGVGHPAAHHRLPRQATPSPTRSARRSRIFSNVPMRARLLDARLRESST